MSHSEALWQCVCLQIRAVPVPAAIARDLWGLQRGEGASPWSCLYSLECVKPGINAG